MAIYWPAHLPSAWLAGVRYAPQDQVLRSPMDAGPAKVRRKHSAVARQVSASVRWTGTDVSAFEAWFNDTLAGGSLRFTALHPVTKVAAEYRFRLTPTWDSDVPSDDPQRALWRAVFELELMP